MTILTILLFLLLIHFAVFFVVGLFTKKKFPETNELKKYGIFVAARNEEAVVGNLIDSIKKNNYPQEKLTIFVIAHNCTDNTAQVAREHGAIVYEYNNDNERTKGYAIKYLFEQIKKDYGINYVDGYIGLDADNILDVNYITELNKAFVANGGKNVITSFRNSKNFGTNIISAMYGMYFIQGCRFESRGRTVTGCSTRISGTGYVVPAAVLDNGWNYVTLTEDWEFSADQILRGNKIIYCDEAIFYDEQPTHVKIMLRQRLRWARGHLLVCLSRFKDLIKGLFVPASKGGAKYKGSVYDITVNILPIPVISFSMFLIEAILYAFAPLFGYELAEVWLIWAISLMVSAIVFYLSVFLTGVLLVIIEHKRINRVNIWKLIAALIVWPIFLFISIPLEFISLFMHNVGWKTIPHKDTTTFEHVNGREENDDVVIDSSVKVQTDSE
jgi:cellulose synthase/poly-beta-1,6-N-acetylglucosamine synthase-like glycosyltransferase